jgi:hypothetical protein
MDSACYLRNCTQPGQLTEQAPKIKNLCQVPVTVHEDVDGCKFNTLFGGIVETNRLDRAGPASRWRYRILTKEIHSPKTESIVWHPEVMCNIRFLFILVLLQLACDGFPF